jgi:CAAX prenyl protease-like protein
VATVPLAEELAYRGYLMRRLQSEGFERTPYAAVRWPALGISSLAFGVMHGAMWLPGTLAGVAYGLLARRSGGLGGSVLAHSLTNALLAACVLGLADWRLW